MQKDKLSLEQRIQKAVEGKISAQTGEYLLDKPTSAETIGYKTGKQMSIAATCSGGLIADGTKYK